MYNIRYHIASLASVFLALALGLVLGGLIVDKTSTGSQSSLVTGLKQEFASLRSENDILQKDTDAFRAYSDDLTKRYLSTELTGKTIAVLGYNNKAMEIAHSDVTSTGGKAVLIVFHGNKLDLENKSLDSTKIVESIMTEKNLSDENDAIASAIATEWAPEATARPLTDAFVKDGIFGIANYEKFKGVDGVVDVAIDGDKVSTMAIKIAGAFKDAEKPALCASMYQGNNVLATRGWNNEVTSTDMLSTSIGTYTIAAVMNGAEDGLYGTMDGAKAVFPAMK